MTNSDDEVRAITREASARQNVSYSEPVVLSESTRRRVVMVPFFIQHTDRTELAVKIVTYLKRRRRPTTGRFLKKSPCHSASLQHASFIARSEITYPSQRRTSTVAFFWFAFQRAPQILPSTIRPQ